MIHASILPAQLQESWKTDAAHTISPSDMLNITLAGPAHAVNWALCHAVRKGNVAHVREVYAKTCLQRLTDVNDLGIHRPDC